MPCLILVLTTLISQHKSQNRSHNINQTTGEKTEQQKKEKKIFFTAKVQHLVLKNLKVPSNDTKTQSKDNLAA